MEDPAFFMVEIELVYYNIYVKRILIGGFFNGYISTWLCSTTHFPLVYDFMLLIHINLFSSSKDRR